MYWLRTGRGVTASNVYFVRSGPSWVLIDAAWPWCTRPIEEGAEPVFGTDAPPVAVLLTHDHPDHAGSAPALARLWGLIRRRPAPRDFGQP